MGLGLGNKMSKAFSSLGNKTAKLTTKMGNKTNSVVKEVKGVGAVLKKKAGQIENTATNAMDQTRNAINRIPELNDKAIRLGNRIIDKSGQATNMLRKGSGIAAALTKGISQIGGDVPVVGSLLKAGSKATDLLAKGAKRLDNGRDKASNKLDKYEQASNETINDIEKLNSRKKMMALQAEDMNDGFA